MRREHEERRGARPKLAEDGVRQVARLTAADQNGAVPSHNGPKNTTNYPSRMHRPPSSNTSHNLLNQR